MKRASALLGLVLLLAGCGGGGSTSDGGADVFEQTVKLNDGRAVVCVTVYVAGAQGWSGVGLSCDWAGAQ